DARAAIEAQGELLRHDEWGERAMAYPIQHKASAEYHLLQFHAAGGGLLDALNRSLRITDGVVRFRLIKLKPGVPDAPDMRASAPARRADADAEPGAGPAPETEAAPAAEGSPAEPASAA